MMKISLILFVICALVGSPFRDHLSFVIPVSTFAVSPTPTNTQVASPTSTDEIQKIRQAIQEKVKEKLKEIGGNVTQIPVDSKQAIIGTVIQTSPTQITIDYHNATTLINITQDTVFIDQNRNKTKIDKLKIGQDILVMGFVNDQKAIDAKRIMFSNLKTINNSHQTIVGRIVDISKSSPIFVLIPSSNKNIQYQLKNDSKTVVVSDSNKTLDQKSLTAGQKVIVIVKPDPKSSKTFIVQKLINFGPFPSLTPTPTKK